MRYTLNLLQFSTLKRTYPRCGTRGSKISLACARRIEHAREPWPFIVAGVSADNWWRASIPGKNCPWARAPGQHPHPAHLDREAGTRRGGGPRSQRR